MTIDQSDEAIPVVESDARLLILVRHGIAEKKSETIPDDERRLTNRGLRRVKSASRGRRILAPSATEIYTSPAARCIETALEIARRFDRDEVESIDALAKDGSVDEAIEFMKEIDHDAILVGHEPNLSSVILRLLGSSSDTPL